MKSIFGFMLVAFALIFTSSFAEAGFRAYNGTKDLKVAQGITCSSGLDCAVNVKTGQMTMANSGANALQARVAAVSSTLTAAACGKTYYNTATATMVLPLASTVLGCRITFITANASNFVIDANAVDQILVLTNAIGDSVTNATVGNSLTIEASAALQWTQIATIGTWTDTN